MKKAIILSIVNLLISATLVVLILLGIAVKIGTPINNNVSTLMEDSFTEYSGRTAADYILIFNIAIQCVLFYMKKKGLLITGIVLSVITLIELILYPFFFGFFDSATERIGGFFKYSYERTPLGYFAIAVSVIYVLTFLFNIYKKVYCCRNREKTTL